MSIVEIHNLSFSYGRGIPPVIERFSCSIEKGDIVGIVGASGNGKSTLLRLIAGLEIPAGGEIRINGAPVVNESTFVQPEQRGVGMVFQDYALFPHMNVRKNIEFALHRLPRKERAKRLEEMLDLVQLGEFKERYPHELSGGQQQRVALARALAQKPTILLMDEPFSNLDAGLKESIRSELRTILKKAEMTCLFVTHDRQDVEAISDRSIHLRSEPDLTERKLVFYS
ncbi:ABC transporter [Paenibacillus sp. VTT E-133280]|jgi:iron(III) transport system ATP-binding protein|uniref:ABC transporter ATP-binding protein n=1 Tax=unclassified Paenibacillus TaxID=185978 RepID=UPI0004F7C507|nr:MULTISPECIES: ABC transporter ATP-binding protein [unclassified Paenibacillus]MBY3621320.1 ABC transporter ATP-binding protein [Acinetobacter sp. CUI P1]AIQ18585.1 ABC transporter [Paenibacillus sp. FSL H7-0357]MDH6373080.1 iron(III) transport system ATP-binding protein [Paenibacillus sp. PastF-3]OZQ62255.1 ABC transporter [Paenibacillus sp. VTT E-133280]OZQ77754.1 ABC transporter [Paenibacillus sp. VTT E-133291]